MTLDRRRFLHLAGAAGLAPLLARCGPGGWPGYAGSVVVDALASPIQFNIPQEGLPLRDAVLDAVRASGITALNLTVNDRGGDGLSAFEATSARMAAWRREIAAHPDVFTEARSVADVHAAKARGQLALVFGFQDGVPFEEDLARLDGFHALGLRIVQLTYNVENRLGSGSLVPEDAGLTEFGREAVARMDELRVLVDLSHCGPRTTLDGIRASGRPVAITHSGCSALYAHPRSKDDETLRLLADRGGVIGIYLMPFLNPSGAPRAEDVLRHLEHAIQVCGEDHVGIGSDQGIVPLDVNGEFSARFEAVSAQRAAAGIAAPREDTIPYVPELNHPRRLETIATMMAQRGHGDARIEKVLGGNFTRLFAEVWS
jgi:membrane dipeptidase